MIEPVKVNSIEANKHVISEYVVLDLHLLGMKDGTPVLRIIITEVHVINGLKAYLLVDTDVLYLKGIDVILSQQKAIIGSYSGMTIPITTEWRSPFNLCVSCSIWTQKSMIISA